MTKTLCSVGRQSDRCCVGRPWDGITGLDAYVHGEPLPQVVIDAASATGIDPHRLDSHVEGVHGWEPHDLGYDDAVRKAADCLLSGGCS